MSYEEFLEDPYQEEIGGVPSFEFITIAKAKVVPAFQGWAYGEPKVFPYDGSKQAGIEAREKCADYCQGDKQYPKPGMLTIVYAEDVPSHPDGRLDRDWLDFVPTYHSQGQFKQADEIDSELPYDLVLQGLQDNPKVFNSVQWCKLSQEIDAVKEYQGKETSKGYPIRVFVVREIYKDREAAYAAAGVEDGSNDILAGFDANEGLSKFAIDNGWSLPALLSQSQNIHDKIAGAIKGEDVPDGKPMKLSEAKNFICQQYVIDVADLKLLNLEIPF